MGSKKFKPAWPIKYFFPLLYFGLFILDLLWGQWRLTNFGQIDLPGLLEFFIGLFLLCVMFYFFSVEYQLTTSNLLVKYFFWKKNLFEIKNIQSIKEYGDNYFFKKFPFGMGAIEINFKDGKRLLLIGLSEQSNFLREIKSRVENN
jgi:hypothetical protein